MKGGSVPLSWWIFRTNLSTILLLLFYVGIYLFQLYFEFEARQEALWLRVHRDVRPRTAWYGRAPKRNIWRAQGIDCHSQTLQRKPRWWWWDEREAGFTRGKSLLESWGTTFLHDWQSPLIFFLIYVKITWALAILLEHMHKKFEINRTKIKGGCQSQEKQ